MIIAAICPTFRHPDLLANSVAMWNTQDYPKEKRLLLILDDAGTFHTQYGDEFLLIGCNTRFPSLPAKYNALLGHLPPKVDAVAIWEDDDTYLPDYISSHVAALEKGPFSKPKHVWCDSSGKGLLIEEGLGKFHSNMAFSRELIESIGGWPDTKRADFDLQLIANLKKAAGPPVDPWPDPIPPKFIYRWHTGAAHGQWSMRSPDDETWYDRADEAYKPVAHRGRLVAKFDEITLKYIKELGYELQP